MKILYARFDPQFKKLDIGLRDWEDLKEFHSYVAANSNGEYANSQTIDEILLADTEKCTAALGFDIKTKKGLEEAYEKTVSYFRENKDLSPADQGLLKNFDTFIKTAKIRSKSLDKKELYEHGALTLESHGVFPIELYLNNVYIGEFDKILEQGHAAGNMDDEGNEIDQATGEVIKPLKPKGKTYGDQLIFIAAPPEHYRLENMEFSCFEPQEALRQFIYNKEFNKYKIKSSNTERGSEKF